MIDSTPLVTIITPSFNQAKFIEATILSVLSQSYKNIEYIVIDGGSTDGSVDIIRKYEKQLAFWVSEKDRGQSDAINKGFRKATGKYLNWLNSDDILQPDGLRTLVEYMERHPEISCVFGNTVFIGPDGEYLFRRREIPLDPAIITYAVNYPPQPSALFRKDIIDRIGLLDETYHYCMDHELWLRMNSAGARFGHLRDFVSGYRLHSASKGILNPRVIEVERLQLRRKFGRNIPNPNLERFAHAGLNLLYRLKRYFLQNLMYGPVELIPGRVRLLYNKLTGRIG